GQDDLVIGTPVSNRSRVELEGLVGFFVNTLVLRLDSGGNPTFTELLRRVKAVALGAYAHQDLPFQKLVEELHPDRDLSRNPLFQVTFQLYSAQDANAGERKVEDRAALRESTGERGSAVFDLAFNLVDGPGGIAGDVEYSTDLFDEPTVRAMVECFKV